MTWTRTRSPVCPGSVAACTSTRLSPIPGDEVAAARAKLAQAELDLARTTIRSPVDGVVARKTVVVGQKVANGAAVMSIVPIQTAYVDANFKEVQLRKVRPGQSVELTSDLYGKA